jgi:hypothetical protein
LTSRARARGQVALGHAGKALEQRQRDDAVEDGVADELERSLCVRAEAAVRERLANSAGWRNA